MLPVAEVRKEKENSARREAAQDVLGATAGRS